MKNLMIIMMLFSTLTFTAYGQTHDVPSNVENAFEQKVSNAKDVEWDYDSVEKMWEVEYEIDKADFEAEFDENGNWLETEKEINYSELPTAVMESLKSNYPHCEIEEVDYVETPEGKFYEVEIELEKDGKELEYDLLFTPLGKIVKKDQDDKEDDDN